MADYKLSSKADADVARIFEYTILNFGLEQARAYLLGLHEHFAALAEHPMQGRSAHEFAPSLRRFEYQSHIVFICQRGRVFGSCASCIKAGTSKNICNIGEIELAELHIPFQF